MTHHSNGARHRSAGHHNDRDHCNFPPLPEARDAFDHGLPSGNTTSTAAERSGINLVSCPVTEKTTEKKSGDALVEAILPSLKANYGKWGFFNDYAGAGIEQIAQELAGKKRLPPNPDR